MVVQIYELYIALVETNKITNLTAITEEKDAILKHFIDSATVWDKCDALITANPRFFGTKHDDKKIIKVNKDYNKECVADFEYDSLLDAIQDETFVSKVYGEQDDNV